MNIQYLLVLLFACAAGGMTYVLAGEPFRKPLARARMSIAARKGMHAKPTQRMKIAEAIDRAGEAFEKIIPLKLSESRELQDKLDLAGLKITPSTWRAISLGITIFTAIMLAGAALVGGYGIAMALLVGIIGAVGGWAVCGVWLSHAGKTRGEEIDRYLPPALELLTISVSAGVLVERGFRQLAENKALGPLADEFARTDMEISHLGVSRVDALDHMRRRCDSPLMGYFCAALIEATRKGTSISGVLESQAKLARKFGCNPSSVLAYEAVHPEMCTRFIARRKKTEMISYRLPAEAVKAGMKEEQVCPLAYARHSRVSYFDVFMQGTGKKRHWEDVDFEALTENFDKAAEKGKRAKMQPKARLDAKKTCVDEAMRMLQEQTDISGDKEQENQNR